MGLQYLQDMTVISIICASVACYNAFELIILIYTTFHSYHSLYLWSMVVASLGIIPYVVGELTDGIVWFR